MRRVIRYLNKFPVNVTHHDAANGAFIPSSVRDLARRVVYDGGNFARWKKWPLAAIFEEADALNAAVWLPIPHRFNSSDFVEMARQIKRLNPRHRPIIEYSNEIWNGGVNEDGSPAGMFIHQHECAHAARRLNLRKRRAQDTLQADTLRSALLYQAQQTIALREAFGDSAEIVLCGQATNTWLIDEWMIQLVPDVVDAIDAIAAGFYWRDADELELVPDRVARWKALADRIGKKLWAYEGGQHCVTADAPAWSDSAEIGRLYDRYLTMLADGGVELVCLYSLWSRHWADAGRDKGEAWGLMNVVDGVATPTVKFRTVRNFVESKK